MHFTASLRTSLKRGKKYKERGYQIRGHPVAEYLSKIRDHCNKLRGAKSWDRRCDEGDDMTIVEVKSVAAQKGTSDLLVCPTTRWPAEVNMDNFKGTIQFEPGEWILKGGWRECPDSQCFLSAYSSLVECRELAHMHVFNNDHRSRHLWANSLVLV